MAKKQDLSIYLSFLLRHGPETLDLKMDRKGWVNARQLIDAINREGQYTLTMELLQSIVAEDSKGRYRFSPDGEKIKACQGHSIPWVEPELEYGPPPEYLYHGTTTEALEKILESGAILKMSRHAVHLQEEEKKAWPSAERWHKEGVVLKIWAGEMARRGALFGVTENGIWCTDRVPAEYIAEKIRKG